MLDFLILAAGLVVLVFGGDYLVRGAVSLAERLNISPIIIGLTIVALGTSAPELFVSVHAALGDAPGIALGNVIGSNTANVLLVLGAPAIIAPLAITAHGIRSSLAIMMAFTIGLIWFMYTDARVSHLEGLILLIGLMSYLIWQFIKVKQQRKAAANAEPVVAEDDMPASTSDTNKIALFLIIGVIGLPVGAYLTVEAATSIARTFNVSEAVIGVTVVAIGTSLPELVTTVMAAIRKSGGVALGNVVGSNIFNIGLIIGSTALIQPLAVDPHLMTIDVEMMVYASVLLVVLAILAKPIQRWGGLLMLGTYAAYVVLAF